MATIEVIDLLSSPPPAVEPAQSSQKSVAKPLAEEPLKRFQSREIFGSVSNNSNGRPNPKDVDDFVYISDDEVNHLPSMLEVAGSWKARTESTFRVKDTTYNKVTLDFKDQLDWDPFADDFFDDKPPSIPSRPARENRNDFLYLSDDVDDLLSTRNAQPRPSERHTALSTSHKVARNPRQSPQEGKSSSLKRARSDISHPRGIGGMAKAGFKRSRTTIEEEEDPIIFTSSPDVIRVAQEKRERAKREREAIMTSLGDVVLEARHTISSKVHGHISEEMSSDIDLPDLGAITASQSTSIPPARKPRASEPNTTKPIPKKSDIITAEERARRQHEKQEAKAIEAERKRQLREDKVRKKQIAQDLAKVNTLRIDKKVSTPEMIVDLSTDLDEKLSIEARQLLEPLNVECTEEVTPIPNIVRWRRKVEARYNEEMDYWEPVQKHITQEKHILCHIRADDFVKLATSDVGQDLEAHLLSLRTTFRGCEPIYLIEGLTAWMRKNRNIKNKKFTNAVRQQADADTQEGTTGGQKPRRKKKEDAVYIDEDIIEDALLKLQIVHGVLIHHTLATIDSAQWIVTFTQHISTIPYRLQRMAMDTAFCMESGQVKTGDDAADTFIKMLQEVTRITAPIAYGIAAEYPSVHTLIKGFERNGKDMLQNLKKSANKDGGFTDREAGKKISRRLWNIFMGTDQTSMDI